MIAGLPLAFAEPLLLARADQPAGAVVAVAGDAAAAAGIGIPADTGLLFDIAPKERRRSRTPWWLTLLRLAAARWSSLRAGPIWNPQTGASASKARCDLLDDGWSAAASWDPRVKAAEN